MARISFEQLARVAEIRVGTATGLPTSITGRSVTVTPVTRSQWAMATIDAYRPLFERMAGAIKAENAAAAPGSDIDPVSAMGQGADPTGQWLAQIMQLLSPMMLGMTAGSMVGHLSTRNFGQYDLPIPRPASDDLPVLVANIDAFGEEWSLDASDLRLWVCLHELTHHAVLGVAHVRARLLGLLQDYVSAFSTDPDSLEHKLGDLDPTSLESMQGFQQLFGDPEVMLGAIQSDRQRELLPLLEALIAVIEGYVDHVMDGIGAQLISSYSRVTEAVRRRRVEASNSDSFVERLFGLELSQDRYDRGTRFIDGVVERAGEASLERLWRNESELPTPAEVDAPGLWLARIDL
jgi:putative hydrolase